MEYLIPNAEPVGSDCCLTPLLVTVPMLIIDNGCECQWYTEVMDSSSADRTAFSMMQSMGAEAFRIDIKLILPSASDVRSVTADLDQLVSHPVRAIEVTPFSDTCL